MNDVFDVKKDKELRPERPIPSGSVNFNYAKGLYKLLLGTGLFSCLFLSSKAFFFALCLIISIFLYNTLLKESTLAPYAMSFCRVFNAILGLSMTTWTTESFVILFIYGLHTFSIMEMAKGENKKASLEFFYYILHFIILFLLITMSFYSALLWLVFFTYNHYNKDWHNQEIRMKTVGAMVLGFTWLDVAICLAQQKHYLVFYPIIIWFIIIHLNKKISVS